MTDLNERDAKLVQYLSEAYGKERELEMSLEAHIAMTTRPPYRKRLQAHLRETKGHSKAVERRIKQLGGGGEFLQTLIGKVQAAAKGPLHMIRGSGEQEKMLKNAKTEYFNEHEEIATYLAIETLAERVGDRETARLARGIRREEERMARFLEGQIKSLTGAVVAAEVPRGQRDGARTTRRRTARKNGAATTRRPTTRKKGTAAATRQRTAGKRGAGKTRAGARAKR